MLAVSEPGDLVIVANGDGSWDPTLLYLAHRKGWADHARFIGPGNMQRRIDAGARWLIGMREDFWREGDRLRLKTQLDHYEDVGDDGAYFVLRLVP